MKRRVLTNASDRADVRAGENQHVGQLGIAAFGAYLFVRARYPERT